MYRMVLLPQNPSFIKKEREICLSPFLSILLFLFLVSLGGYGIPPSLSELFIQLIVREDAVLLEHISDGLSRVHVFTAPLFHCLEIRFELFIEFLSEHFLFLIGLPPRRLPVLLGLHAAHDEGHCQKHVVCNAYYPEDFVKRVDELFHCVFLL